MPAQLLALTDGPSILLDKPILLLGRHPECDIQLNSRKVSRRHCCIAQVHDYLVVRDLGSTNGIRINGSRVLEGRLRSGDEVTIGNFRYQVSWDEIETPRAVPRRKGERQTPAATMNDQLLEEADEPVALDESGDSRVLAARPAAAPVARVTPPSPQADASTHGTISDSGMSLFIPEHLNLLPNSAVRKHGPEPG